MITVVEQSTSERKRETRELFESIRPYLDKGYTYKQSLVFIGRVSKSTHLNRRYGWFRDLIEYGSSMGYLYGDFMFSHEDKVGKRKVLVWDHLW